MRKILKKRAGKATGKWEMWSGNTRIYKKCGLKRQENQGGLIG